jgi:tetratricopeptide (TPR) repeat protein
MPSCKLLVAFLVALASPAHGQPANDPWGAPNRPGPSRPNLVGPRAEVRPSPKVTLPSVPAFELPVAAAGTHSVQELHVTGRPYLGTKIRVAGYVTWIYDCVAELQRPGQTRAQVQRRIDQDPTQCQRAKLYLGDTRDTPAERSLWVVDVPRPFNKLEVERIKKEDRTLANYPDRCEPDRKRRGPFCTELAVGDYVVIAGTFAIRSPHYESNSDGLLVWDSVQKATPPAKVVMHPVVFPAPPTLPAISTTPRTVPVADAAASRSITATNDGNGAYGRKDFALAVTKFREAVKLWAGNHTAWYGMGGAQAMARDWPAAEEAFRHAFELAPTEPMYAMMYGVAVYNRVIEDARNAQGKQQNVKPESVDLDMTGLDFSRAEALLRHAVKLNDKLWRAHYYLGRIARDGGRDKEAAESLTSALAYGPTGVTPWIALAELYRKWLHPELAVALAEEGVKQVPGADATDVWFVLGMAHDDLRRDDQAIEAFGKALAIKPDHAKALFQRGQAYYRKRDAAAAKRDLEAFVKSTAPNLAFERTHAQRLLLELASKPRKR